MRRGKICVEGKDVKIGKNCYICNFSWVIYLTRVAFQNIIVRSCRTARDIERPLMSKCPFLRILACPCSNNVNLLHDRLYTVVDDLVLFILCILKLSTSSFKVTTQHPSFLKRILHNAPKT